MISVIIPVYNVEKYIRKCFECLLKQTYKDLQIIVINDGSMDNSINIINEYIDKFKCIEIINQENMGASIAKNNGLKYAKGEYTLYIDPDDFIDEKMIETMYKSAVRNNSDIVLCGYYLYYQSTEKKVKVEYELNSNKVYSNEKIIEMMLRHEIQGQLCNKLFKTKVLIENNFAMEKGRVIEDIFPVFKVVCNVKRISYVDKILYYYRQHETSAIHTKNVKTMNDYYYAMTCILNYVNENNIPVNKNSIKIFKATALLILLKRYQNIYGNKIYNDFKKEEYYNFNLSLYEIIFLKDFSLNYKIKLILWKIRLFNVYYSFKTKLLVLKNNN